MSSTVKVGKLKLKIRVSTQAVPEMILPPALAADPPKPGPAKLVSDFSGELQLASEMKKEKPKKPLPVSIAELAKMEDPPEGMDRSIWERKIAAEKLISLFNLRMKERWNYDPLVMTPMERACFKNFYSYFQDLQRSVQILEYVIENWVSVKSRYRLHYEHPCAKAFSYVTFIKQVAIEFHKKSYVTHEEPQYVMDFRNEEMSDESEYKIDW